MYKNTRSHGFRGRKNRPGPGFRSNLSGRYINPARFINKPVDSTMEEEYVPKFSFSNFNLKENLLQNVLKKGYKNPTPIQDQTIPPIMAGRDVIGIANTGTGKTAAFLIPLINSMHTDGQLKALVVAPTRELALQIRDEFTTFTEGSNLSSVLIIGGTNIQRQEGRLRRDYNIIIATPGRLLDLVKRNSINLSRFTKIVLDEVDRMLDIGFIYDVKRIISYLPKMRQSLFFSATIGRREEEIVGSFVSDPIKIEIVRRETAETVEQDIVRVQPPLTKLDVLHDILIQEDVKKVLIFGRTKWGVDKLSKRLAERGFKAGTIHGGKSQGHRQSILEAFREDKIKILTATDVASRGIDVDNITHVINYDPPETWEDYIHRIGRTGRANKRGKALTFLD
ncbi:MAG: DEAD/DEAH box helicase [Candidatus Roizmanbacteria bacterium]|nr:DEAD/DEAH box helicase [Candidatus Roizmanbacteria bacterium]